jgi:hypothetical protein
VSFFLALTRNGFLDRHFVNPSFAAQFRSLAMRYAIAVLVIAMLSAAISVGSAAVIKVKAVNAARALVLSNI